MTNHADHELRAIRDGYAAIRPASYGRSLGDHTHLVEQRTWLAGFDADRPVWVPKVEEAAIYDREGVEGARLRCTGLPDLNDVLYAVCHLKD